MAIITTPQFVCDPHGEECTGGPVETYRFVGQVTETITTTEKVQTGTEQKIVNNEIAEIPVYEEKETTETVTRIGLLEKELCEKLRKAHEEATALLGDKDNREIRSLPTQPKTSNGTGSQQALSGMPQDLKDLKLGPELTEEVREWGKKEGFEVKERGALKGDLKTAFFKMFPGKIPA